MKKIQMLLLWNMHCYLSASHHHHPSKSTNTPSPVKLTLFSRTHSINVSQLTHSCGPISVTVGIHLSSSCFNHLQIAREVSALHVMERRRRSIQWSVISFHEYLLGKAKRRRGRDLRICASHSINSPSVGFLGQTQQSLYIQCLIFFYSLINTIFHQSNYTIAKHLNLKVNRERLEGKEDIQDNAIHEKLPVEQYILLLGEAAIPILKLGDPRVRLGYRCLFIF